MRLTRRAFVAASTLAAAAFQSRWRGSRVWIGPEYWANPLQDWRMENGVVVAQAAAGRTLHLLTHQMTESGNAELSVSIVPPRDAGATARAGFRIGIRGKLDDYRHALVLPTHWVDAAISADGTLAIDDAKSEARVAFNGAVTLRLRVDGCEATLSAGKVRVTKKIRPAGNIALLAEHGEWRFRDWTATGTQLAAHPEQTFGPVLWTQYLAAGGVLKVTALFAPMETRTANFEVRSGAKWRTLAEAPIDPMSRTAAFRIPNWDSTVRQEYRVSCRWQNRTHQWGGHIRAEPAGGKLNLGVFSCDNGYVFPMTRLVQNAKHHDPDLLYFAGDQIYEGFGGFGITREPASVAMLDYLRKFWQFGWTWRELLKDRPSVVIPDDHDMFQGNIWGHGGRAIPKGREKGFVYGGFVQHPDWVNAVQRTQSGHLPDAVDAAPIEQGIEVYFTRFRYGGIDFAVLEDRKFKHGPENAGPDPEMLGARQERFVREWSAASRSVFKVVLSQTIFCKVTTHAGQALNRGLEDKDCGGWPQAGRLRALRAINDRNAVMLHGDQHVGALVRQGIDDWDDGPLAFMVPGTANGFPRAWWPEQEKADGRYIDDLGNKMTVLGIANPEKGSNELPRARTQPELLAHKKGSGYGIVRFDAAARSLTFEMWRYQFDAAHPKPEDQFPGFPKKIRL